MWLVNGLSYSYWLNFTAFLLLFVRVLLDAFARRHEAQKIYLRQAAAQRWIEYREQILVGGRPNSKNQVLLRQVDNQLRVVRRRPLLIISMS